MSNIAKVVVVAGLALAGTAFAQTRAWNFGDQTAPGSCGSIATPAYGNSVNCTEQPTGTTNTLAVSAYSSTATGTTYATAALNYWGTGSGFGAYNQSEGLTASSPNHALDNNTSSGAIDMMLLSFTSAQVLKNVTLGWSDVDGDFQVLAYTGSTAFSTSSILNKTAAQLVGGGGWSLVSTVDGAGGISTPDVQYGVNTGNTSSSYWLITAFNSGFGGSLSAGNDAIKVLGVGSVNGGGGGSGGVPEPTSLALAGVALAGLFGVRRRAAKRN